MKPFRHRQAMPVYFVGILLFIVLAVFTTQLFRAIAPFYTLNPFVHKKTIGEDIIGKWKYGGVDDQGKLQFYNGFQTVKVPASSLTFDAEGSYVVIKEYTANTITIQNPRAVVFQGIVFIVVILIFMVGAVGIFLRVNNPAGLSRKSSWKWVRRIRLRRPLRRKW